MKIAIYPGSFNPFHLGHKNIIDKALNIFDKVVVAQGSNPAKDTPCDLNINYPHVITDRYTCSLAHYILENYQHIDYFVLRGLRNGYDLAYEETLRKIVEDSIPNIRFVYLFCDRKYEHISSSMIRQLKSLGEDVGMYLPEGL